MDQDGGVKRLWDEHRKVEALAERLRVACGYVPRNQVGEWLSELRGAFEAFRAHMIRMMALERRDGYLQAAIEKRPSLAKETEALSHEHHELTWLLTSINEAVLKSTPEDRLLLLDACKRIQNVLSYVEHHERAEGLILMTAYTADLGTMD